MLVSFRYMYINNLNFKLSAPPPPKKILCKNNKKHFNALVNNYNVNIFVSNNILQHMPQKQAVTEKTLRSLLAANLRGQSLLLISTETSFDFIHILKHVFNDSFPFLKYMGKNV